MSLKNYQYKCYTEALITVFFNNCFPPMFYLFLVGSRRKQIPANNVSIEAKGLKGNCTS